MLKRYGFMTALLLPAIFFLIVDERFRSAQNLSNVLAQSSIVGVVAIGMTLVMILGGFDLSVGAVAALSGLCAVVVFGHGDPLHMALGVAAAIGCGIAIGLVNGVLISRLSINPLIATLAMASIVRGVVLIASEGTIYRAQGDAAAITIIALGRWHVFPIAGFFFIGSIILGWFILKKMRFGHYIYAIGGSETASTLAGLPVSRMVIVTYAIVGGFAGARGAASPGANRERADERGGRARTGGDHCDRHRWDAPRRRRRRHQRHGAWRSAARSDPQRAESQWRLAVLATLHHRLHSLDHRSGEPARGQRGPPVSRRLPLIPAAPSC